LVRRIFFFCGAKSVILAQTRARRRRRGGPAVAGSYSERFQIIFHMPPQLLPSSMFVRLFSAFSIAALFAARATHFV
jgi:hypothetical protein